MKRLESIMALVFLLVLILPSCEPDEEVITQSEESLQEEELIIKKEHSSINARTIGLTGSLPDNNTFHTYTRTIDLTGCPAGTQVSLACQALDVPNNFYVVGTSANSGWLGYASYAGPWGSSINGPSTRTISFTKGTANTYTLKVETLTQTQDDRWYVTIRCPN